MNSSSLFNYFSYRSHSIPLHTLVAFLYTLIIQLNILQTRTRSIRGIQKERFLTLQKHFVLFSTPFLIVPNVTFDFRPLLSTDQKYLQKTTCIISSKISFLNSKYLSKAYYWVCKFRIVFPHELFCILQLWISSMSIRKLSVKLLSPMTWIH